MYAVKLKNGDEMLVAAVPEDAVCSFEFDVSELPANAASKQKLVIDFEKKCFSLKSPDKTTAERLHDIEAENKLLKAQVAAQSEQLDFYEECIVELANQVYA